MCVYSMIVDHYGDKWYKRIPQPWTEPAVQPSAPYVPYPVYTPVVVPQISPADIAEFYELLRKAREYDKKHGEPDCELDEKKERLKSIAKALGVKIEFSE